MFPSPPPARVGPFPPKQAVLHVCLTGTPASCSGGPAQHTGHTRPTAKHLDSAKPPLPDATEHSILGFPPTLSRSKFGCWRFGLSFCAPPADTWQASVQARAPCQTHPQKPPTRAAHRTACSTSMQINVLLIRAHPASSHARMDTGLFISSTGPRQLRTSPPGAASGADLCCLGERGHPCGGRVRP